LGGLRNLGGGFEPPQPPPLGTPLSMIISCVYVLTEIPQEKKQGQSIRGCILKHGMSELLIVL